jgi:hypothetical protein
MLVVCATWGCSVDRSALGEIKPTESGGSFSGAAENHAGVGGTGGGGYGGSGGVAGTGGYAGISGGAGGGEILAGTGGGGVGGAVDSGVLDAAAGQAGYAGEDTTVPDAGGAGGSTVVTSAGVPYGDWMYYEVQGAVCRDGSAAGYYLREGTSQNLMVFLNGGGVCYDDFFCAINPANVNQSLPGETLVDATLQTFMGAISPVRQVPPEDGILKKDPLNPVGDWTMVYVPYCTGDVYAGTTPNSPVITSTAVPPLPPQQFMGYANLGLFYQSFGPGYLDSVKVLLAGSSAGGFGTLLNFDRTQQFFSNSIVYAITDSGIPFRDQYLEPCLQKNWRDLWGVDKILPPDCTECFHPDGGGLTELSTYILQKYPGRVLGGGVSSNQDEVMKLFFGAGLNECTMPALFAMGSYPLDRYPLGLTDFIENVLGGDKAGSYMTEGTTHQHLFRPRYYEENGVGMTLAAWVGEILNDNPVHVGVLP